MPDTAKRMARVPILGEDGRISDDYVPAAIGEGVEAAEAAAKRAETAATAAEGSASAASQSATGAQGSASAASTSATKAQQSATAANEAVTQAQSAQKAAEKAKTGAESARGSAQTAASQAQQSATAAEESAASVADKYIASAQATTLEPGSEATASVADQVLTLGIPRGDKGDKGDTGEKGDPGDVSAVQAAEGSDLSVSTDEGTVTIDDSALRARISELEQQTQNVVTGTSTGLVSHGEDAFPQKPREVRIKGKTWVNRWPVIEGTKNGSTISTDETGLITITGEPTSDTFFSSDKLYCFAANKSYAFAVSKDIGFTAASRCYIELFSSEGTRLAAYAITGDDVVGNNFTTPANTNYAVCRVAIYPSAPITGSFRVMLVDGTEAPDCFTPPASITSAQPENLVTAGKNLLKFRDNLQPLTLNGLTFTPNEDGTVTVNGTATAIITDYYIVGVGWGNRAEANFPASDLVFSTNGIAKMYGFDSDGAQVIAAFVNNGQKQIEASKAQACAKVVVYLSYAAGQGESNKRVYVQLELGSTATDYEPPTVTQTALPEVELRSLPNGTCDELVIKADGTCEVEKHTQKVYLDGSDDEGWAKYSVNENACVISAVVLPYNHDGASFDAVVCDKLPSISSGFDKITPSVSLTSHSSHLKNVYVNLAGIADDIDSAVQWLKDNPITVVTTASDTPTEPQSPVTLPALPAPTFNQYHDSLVPSDTSTQYVRDINIVLDNLAKQVAGTASAVAVREASTIEEE